MLFTCELHNKLPLSQVLLLLQCLFVAVLVLYPGRICYCINLLSMIMAVSFSYFTIIINYIPGCDVKLSLIFGVELLTYVQ